VRRTIMRTNLARKVSRSDFL